MVLRQVRRSAQAALRTRRGGGEGRCQVTNASCDDSCNVHWAGHDREPVRGGGSGAVLQRGARDRQGRRRFPRRAARRHDLCLRQQFDRRHGRGGAAGRRRGPPRDAPGQGPRGAPHVQRHRGRHLRAGRRRRHLRRAERAGDDRKTDRRPARHGGGLAHRPRRGRLSPRPPHRQRHADRLHHPHLRPRLHRYSVRLPGVLAALRQIVSDPVRRLRDRDRIDGACAGAGIAGGRDTDAVLFAAGRIGLEARRPGTTAFASCGPC